MTAESKLADLLQRWKSLRQAGQAVTPELLCVDCPELLPRLRRQIDELGAADQLQQTDPPSDPETLRPPPPHDMLHAETFVRPRPGEHRAASGGPAGLWPGSEPVPGYQLVARLGRGGFGEVWKATAPGGFSVALKLVPLHERVGATELQSLEIIKGIRHPNLLTAFGAWQRDGMLIVAMELADRTLWERFQEARDSGTTGIPPEELLDYMREAAKGIDFLNEPRHTVGGKERVSIQHRDIKPQNILLVGSGVKIADFGLVRLLEKTMASHSGSMSPAYAAPEFLRGQTAAQSDQYGLAITYCEVRGGRLPFSGTHAQVMHGHLSEPPDLTMLPEQERPVVARALSKEPADRWPTCRAFVAALAACTQSKAVPAKAASPMKPHRRSRAGWLALPIVAAGIAAAAFYLQPQWREYAGPTRQQQRSPPPDNPGPPPQIPSAAEATSPSAADVPSTTAPEETPAVVTPAIAPTPDDDQPKAPPASPPVTSPDEVQPAPAASNPTVSPAPEATDTQVTQPEPPAVIPQPMPAAAPDLSPIVPRPPVSAPPAPPFVGELRSFTRHTGPVRAVSVSPLGRLALSAGDDRIVRMWDLETGEEVHQFPGHTAVVNGTAFSPDGLLAASASDDSTVRLWSVAAKTELHTLRGHTSAVYAVTFTPDGLSVVSAGNDLMVRVWDLESRKERNRFGLSDEAIWSAALSPNGRDLLTASDSKLVRLWDLPLGMEAGSLEGHRDVVWAVAISPNGELGLSGGGSGDGNGDCHLRLWDIRGRKLLRELRGHTNSVGSVAFSPDGRRALSGSSDRTVRLWDVETSAQLHSFNDHANGVYSVTFSHDGKRALSASHDGTVRVWALPP